MGSQAPVTGLTAVNEKSIVEQSRELQPELATQSQRVVSLSGSELGTAQPQLVLFHSPSSLLQPFLIEWLLQSKILGKA